MHTGLPMVSELRGDIHASLQQKLDNVGAAVLARPCEAVLHLFLRGVRREPAVRVEKCLDDVETTDAGGGLEIQSISASGEELGGAWPSVRMTRVDQLRPRGRALFAAQRRATREQKGHQLFLHACGNRMDARRREAKRAGAAAVHVSRRVDVSARA